MVFEKGKWFFCLLGAILLPSLQSIIWISGSLLNEDLRAQFAHPGIDDGIIFTHVFAGGAQFLVGGILGFLTSLACSSSPPFRRLLLMSGGLLGIAIFGYCLSNSWNFEANHCSPDAGCDMESSIAIDFVPSVFLGLPLWWCVMVVFVAIIMRDEKSLANQ